MFLFPTPSQYADDVVRYFDTWGWMDGAWAVATQAPCLSVGRFVMDGESRLARKAIDRFGQCFVSQV